MVADGFSRNITGDLYDHHMPSYLLSSDDSDKDMDDPNTIGRVLEYVLVDGASEARRSDVDANTGPRRSHHIQKFLKEWKVIFKGWR
jgi:hypothetical protein